MKIIVTETALETKFWSTAIRTEAYFLQNGFTVPQPCPVFYDIKISLQYSSSIKFYIPEKDLHATRGHGIS